MAQPTTPFPYLKSLSPADQQRLRRDFDELWKNISSTRVFDVYVDPTIAADSPSTLTFKTPFSAILYASATLGKSVVSIGWIYSGLDQASNIAVEAGSYTGASGLTQVSITVIGQDNQAHNKMGLTVFGPRWDIATFNDGGKIQYLQIQGLELRSSGAATPFTNASFAIAATESRINLAGHAPMPQGVYRSCRFFNSPAWPTVGTVWLWDCAVDSINAGTLTKNFYAFGCAFGALGAQTISAQEFVASGCVFTNNGDGFIGATSAIAGISSIFTWSGVGATTRIHIESIGETGTANQGLVVSIPAGAGSVFLSGKFWSITLGAPNGVSTNDGSAHYVDACLIGGLFDITGPAVCKVVGSHTGGNTLRGEGIGGSFTVFGATNSGAALALVGVKDSAFTVSFQKLADTPSTGKAYSIDAASGPGVMVEEGDGLFPSASTNLSATFLVINHLGTPPSGAATGDLTGTYPAPTLDLTKAHTWTAEQKAPDLVATGLTGATAASRYVGATASGAPASGTFAVGDFVVDQTGTFWICTTAGTPGSWSKPTSAPTAPSNVIFTANGTFTKASFPNLRAIKVRLVGGGAGGGGVAAGVAGNRAAGSGGGAGGYAETIIPAASLAASETVTVGAGGTGVSAATGNGGGTTSFGTWASATGGAGGSGSPSGTSAIRGGGAGGAGSAGDVQATGSVGGLALVLDGSHSLGGVGGNTIFGAGGAGASAPGDGGVATGFGAGGGGATNSTANQTGGAGTAGIVIVELVF